MKNTSIIKNVKEVLKVTIIEIIFVFSSIVYAEASDFIWVKQANGYCNSGTAIVSDRLGNSYIIGQFEEMATIGTTTLTSIGLEDIYIAKYNAMGAVLWAKNIGSANNDYGFSIATDSLCNCYVTGRFYSTATFGTITLVGKGHDDIFIVKCDPSGNVLWAKQAGGPNWDVGLAIITNQSGYSIVTGVFEDTATFDNITVSSPGNDVIFIAKYDASGNVIWAKKVGVTNFGCATDIGTDGLGNFYITGRFHGTAIFDTKILTSVGKSDVFVAKYNASGHVLWAKRAGGTDYDYGNAIATDNLGNCIIIGNFHNTEITFDTTTLTNAGYSDVFIVKYDTGGNLLWAKKAGGRDGEYGNAIATDNLGNCIIIGNFHDTAIFDTITLNSAGSSDIFIANYDPSGNILWAERIGGVDGEYGEAIVKDVFGNYIFTGYFRDTGLFGTTLLTSSDVADTYIAKMRPESIVTLVESEEHRILEMPLNFSLGQNYPNPFNPETYIDYQLPEDEHVVIKIFNSLGQEIKTLIRDQQMSGYYTISWNGIDSRGNQVSSGIYIYQIKAGEFIDYRKMALIR